MLHTLARIGRSKYGRYVFPVLAGAGSTGYLLLHGSGYKLIRKFLISQTYPGQFDKITPELQNLIYKAFEDCKKDMVTHFFDERYFEIPNIQLKCFSSSTLDPSSWGVRDFESGIFLGVPNYFNFKNPSDIPEEFMKMKRVSIFKNSEGEKSDINVDKSGIIQYLETDESAADEYKKSMIISDEAKLFCIARELHYASTYRVPMNIFAFYISAYLSNFLSRFSLERVGLLRKHMGVRLFHYSVMTLVGGFNFLILVNAIDQYFCRQSDMRAIKTGEIYRRGAIEYYEHVINRNKALRNYVKGGDRYIDEEGELKSILKLSMLKLFDTNRNRLDYVKNLNLDETSQ